MAPRRHVFEAASVAMYMPAAIGGCNELFAIVASNGRVLRVVADPGVPGSMRVWVPRIRGAERGDERVLYVAVRPRVEMSPPDDEDVRAFAEAKRVFAKLGCSLLHMMLTDGNVQSLSRAPDENSHWPDEQHGTRA